MTKASLIEEVYQKTGFTKEGSGEIIEMVFDLIKATLETGQQVNISGFGAFVVREKKERTGRNPKTGEKLKVAARRVLTFKPSHVLRNQMNRS